MVISTTTLRQTALIAAPTALYVVAQTLGAKHQTWLSIVIGVAAIVLSVFAGWWVSRSSGTLTQPVAVAKQIMSGDLTARFTSQGSGEFKELMDTLIALNARIAEVIGEVRTRSTTTVGASSQIARDCETVRIRSEVQVESLERTAHAMEQLNQVVARNTDDASRANGLVVASSQFVTAGSTAMSEAVSSMQSIRDSSRKIVDILTLIDSIAFQTNILALNAAVEAARAGEYGRGFAVVAGEVGTLAKRSATAAKEIKKLIGDSVRAIESGGKAVDAAGMTMSSIDTSVKSLTAIANSMTRGSEEQRRSIDMVNETLGEMMRVSRTNTRMFADLIKGAGTLNEQAVTLLKSISGFDLGIRENGTPEEARAMVKRAVEFLNTHGREQFLADVNKVSKGQFIERDLYLVVCDANTYKYVGHGLVPRTLNYDSRLVKDPRGHAYMGDLIDTAKRNGETWYEYLNNHPLTNEVLQKRSFVQCVGDLVILCGAYI